MEPPFRVPAPILETRAGPRKSVPSVLVAAAAFAAFRLERVAAAAGGLGVRILDREAAAHQVFLVVDLGAVEVAEAHRVDDDLDAVRLDHLVVLGDLVEDHAVLEARAAASLDVD